MIDIREGGLDEPQVIALLRLHMQGMLANSPAESVHALDLSGLRRADVSFYAAWDGDDLLGVGALKQIDATHGEIKSMRTAPAHLRRGAAAALLEHILRVARERGYARLSLETGSGEPFEAAHALYRRHGFTDCAAFGEYPEGDPFSRFMTLAL